MTDFNERINGMGAPQGRRKDGARTPETHHSRAESLLESARAPLTVSGMIEVARVHALLAIADELHHLNAQLDHGNGASHGEVSERWDDGA